MKRTISVVLLVATFSLKTSAQVETNLIDTTNYYAFHLNYWFNMHHFLWMEAFMNVKADSTVIDIELPAEAKVNLETALRYFREKLVDEDPRRSDYMTDFKVWITYGKTDLKAVPAQFAEHMDVLFNFDTTYKRHFWPKHKQASESTLEANIGYIRSTEEEFVKRITKWTRQFWQGPEKVRVDITYFGKSTTLGLGNNPYTTVFPTHVVMNVAGENEMQGNWLELLYHESAHHLILGSSYFVNGTINDLVEAENLALPRQLSHAYLFYFTGHLTRELLADQGVDYPEIYMDRERVFYSYLPLLDKYLRPYMDREITLSDATRKLIKEYYK